MSASWNDQSEWLETDGLGGFSTGTVGGIRTRRYHGLLTTALNPPANRFMLVNGLEVGVQSEAGVEYLSSHRYDGQIVSPEGFKRITSFTTEPWPTWQYTLADGTCIEQQLFVRRDAPVAAISWKATNQRGPMTLKVRPLLSGRDIHALHYENPEFNFEALAATNCIRWRPYQPLPAISAYSNASYQHEPTWYRRFFYQEEWLRGFDAVEDLGSPGIFSFDLKTEAVLIFAASGESPARLPGSSPNECLQLLRRSESQRRRVFATPLHRAADQYVVRRGSGKSIIAGYPWFGDWGRDTSISLRGLCLATGRLEEARQILLAWAPYVSDGMLPNRFPDHGETPEYNTVDAALWYIIAIDALFTAADANPDYFLPDSTHKTLLAAIDAILFGYSRGTRHGIRRDDDGLLRCGEPGVQLTWMDARVGERVITPRIGKPVEIQALWINALHIAARYEPKWQAPCDLALASFRRRFWIESADALHDVVDVDHQPGRCDASCRPNQIFAVGGLPLNLLSNDRASRLVANIEEMLWTPLGLRSLAPDDPAYAGRYSGSPSERDAVYHQGAVWPWLAGAFIQAWVRVRGSTNAAKSEARRRFLAPLLDHLNEAAVGHVSEIADGDAPHMPRGCPFQAWSLAELLRVDQEILRIDPVKPQRPGLHPTPALSRS